MDQGPESIDDEAINAQIRRQAQRVQIKSLVVGLAAAVVAAVL